MSSYAELCCLFVLLMLPFLYESSHKFRYFFKFFLYYGITSFNSIIVIPIFLFRPCDVRNFLIGSALCGRVTSLIGLRWELRGREHLEKDQACVIVANHQSSLDVLGMFQIWPVMNKCTAVAKRELFYAWPFGLAAWLAGLVFIDRVRGEKARATLNAVGQKVKEQRIKLWVFPEGTRRNTGEIHAFKKGAFHMAIEEQTPILPVVFSSYSSFLNDKMKILNAGNIIITTLPPIPTEGLTKDDIPDLIELVHRQMSEIFKQTSAEILQRYGNKSVNARQSVGETGYTTGNNQGLKATQTQSKVGDAMPSSSEMATASKWQTASNTLPAEVTETSSENFALNTTSNATQPLKSY